MENVLLMAFIDESESFVNGFETGQIWEQLKEGMSIEKRACHTSNQEQLKAMCEMFECNYCFEDSEVEGWFWLTVKPSEV